MKIREEINRKNYLKNYIHIVGEIQINKGKKHILLYQNHLRGGNKKLNLNIIKNIDNNAKIINQKKT
jgi:hypothetical protein